MSTFYDVFFSESMPERLRIAQAAGLSLPYIQKHTYTNEREPKFHFHNAVKMDWASNGKLCLIDITEGEIDWAFVLQRLKALQKDGRIGKTKPVKLPTASFDGFWSAYPRKLNKPGALKSWHAQAGDKIANVILADVQRRLADWAKDGGAYIPHPTTYLNQRRWEEQVTLAQPTTGAFAGAL